jgi:hypothetical protein
LFTTPLEGYDILLHLKPSVVTRYAQGVNPLKEVWEEKNRFKNIDTQQQEVAGLKVGFNPAEEFVKDIQVSL